jgi:uracil-DNA glycosylase
VDARDRLRRYLEQRRELGESEFVLDGLSVEDALRLLGAKGGGLSQAAARPPRSTEANAPTNAPSPASSQAPAAASDTEREDRTTPPPPAPDVRFDAQASTDWRETLRQAGTRKPGGDTSPAATTGRSSGATPEQPSSTAATPTAKPSSANIEGVPAVLPDWLAALGVPAGLEAGAARVQDLLPELAGLPSLDAVAQHIAACQRCGLHKTARNPVPGEGHTQAELLCVGEAPGANEDLQGRPFVGEAGQLLTKILAAIQLGREDVFIHNVLKHRPPGNRDPMPEEVLACQPYLLRQIELVRPRVILALGRFAAQTLLQTGTAIGALRGRIHRFHGVPLIVTYHPAALLRNEAWKRPTWEDVKLARRVLDAARAAEPQRSFE